MINQDIVHQDIVHQQRTDKHTMCQDMADQDASSILDRS
jgi:hypothetical protein